MMHSGTSWAIPSPSIPMNPHPDESSSWTTHPGPLILDCSSRRSYFPCTGSGAIRPHKVPLIHTGGAVAHPGQRAALRWILDHSSCPVDPSSRWIPHPMDHPSLDILDQDRDTSSRSSCPVDPGPSRDIVAGGTSWTIPMDPDGSRWILIPWAGDSHASDGPGIRWADGYICIYNIPPPSSVRPEADGQGRIRCLCPNHTKSPQRF